jgi:type I site-specific restriction endonuclease
MYNDVDYFIRKINELEMRQRANIQMKERIDNSIWELAEKNKELKEQLDVLSTAVGILRGVSDEVVQKSYKFIEDNINEALSRIFVNTVRKIRIKEYSRGDHPQLEIELLTEGGRVRSLKTSSGHGIMQVISLLCTLCLIVITNSRRVLAMDEVLSGLSGPTRRIVEEILWAFTEVGFQFIISEHGYILKNSKVYHLEMRNGVSGVIKEYIETEGVYAGSNRLSSISDEIPLEKVQIFVEEDVESQIVEID